MPAFVGNHSFVDSLMIARLVDTELLNMNTYIGPHFIRVQLYHKGSWPGLMKVLINLAGEEGSWKIQIKFKLNSHSKVLRKVGLVPAFPFSKHSLTIGTPFPHTRNIFMNKAI